MLILTRKTGETITIGEKIQVKVLSIKGGQVRIGIDAPREINVNREEVQLQQKSTSTTE
ncbi:MAG: carbon storage regulator CsrA [Mariprofundaceae bacterium]|nr:carbon storage regulator CsrA [Mariprofundaceae bacterium]